MLGRSQTPEVRNLRAFEAAARFGSFSQAATELHLTQGAVSKQLKELEEKLKVELFRRTTRSLVLTDAGRRFLPEAREVLERLERAALDVMALEGRERTLSVATLPTFGSRWLMPRLATFMARYPDVQIDVASRHSPFDFATEPFDIAIHYGAPVWPAATCTCLCGEEIAAVASRVLADRHGLPGLQALGAAIATGSALPLLHLRERPKLWATWLAERDLPTGTAYRGNRFDTFGLLIAGALAGVGIALLPTYLIEAELADGSLVAIDATATRTDRSYHTVVPNDRPTSPICAAFEAWLHDEVRQRPSAAMRGPDDVPE